VFIHVPAQTVVVKLSRPDPLNTGMLRATIAAVKAIAAALCHGQPDGGRLMAPA
jgi:hypothetical protein